MKPGNVIISLLLVLALLLFIFLKQQFWEPRKKITFNRNPSRIEYSPLALCRMDCYRIDANDITWILKKGVTDAVKTKLYERTCPVFTIRGITRKGMVLFIIVSQCGSVVNISTCYSPDETVICNCPGVQNQPVSFLKINK